MIDRASLWDRFLAYLKDCDDLVLAFRPNDVARLLSLSRTQVYRLMDREDNPLPYVRDGSIRLVRRDDLLRWLAAQRSSVDTRAAGREARRALLATDAGVRRRVRRAGDRADTGGHGHRPVA